MSDTNRAVFRKKRGCTRNVAETEGLVSCAGTTQLICGFFGKNFLHMQKSRFFHDAALFIHITITWEFCQAFSTFEPCCEKTGLQGCRPGQTQTSLYSHRRWLEA